MLPSTPLDSISSALRFLSASAPIVSSADVAIFAKKLKLRSFDLTVSSSFDILVDTAWAKEDGGLSSTEITGFKLLEDDH